MCASYVNHPVYLTKITNFNQLGSFSVEYLINLLRLMVLRAKEREKEEKKRKKKKENWFDILLQSKLTGEI